MARHLDWPFLPFSIVLACAWHRHRCDFCSYSSLFEPVQLLLSRGTAYRVSCMQVHGMILMDKDFPRHAAAKADSIFSTRNWLKHVPSRAARAVRIIASLRSRKGIRRGGQTCLRIQRWADDASFHTQFSSSARTMHKESIMRLDGCCACWIHVVSWACSYMLFR